MQNIDNKKIIFNFQTVRTLQKNWLCLNIIKVIQNFNEFFFNSKKYKKRINKHKKSTSCNLTFH